jgi:hypothetical protein
MDVDGAVPNELAYSLAGKCRKWTYATYSGEYEVNEVPLVASVERAYETRLERAINDAQAKITSQKRVLEDVPPSTGLHAFWQTVLMVVTEDNTG